MKVIFFLAVMLMLLPQRAYADEYYSEFAEKSGAYSLGDSVPDEAKSFLSGNGITVDDPQTILNISPTEIISELWNGLKAALKKPLTVFGTLLAVIVVYSVIDGIKDSVSNSGVARVFSTVSALSAVGVLIEPMSERISATAAALTDGGNFMLSYIPIYTGILAACGNVSSSVCYNTVVFMLAQAAVRVASLYLMPALSLCMALAVVDALNPSIRLGGLISGIKKLLNIVLSFVMTIFVGLLTIQSVVGSSADSVGIRASRYIVSNFVPVVGGAISDAYSNVIGSLALLKNGVGSFGVIALVLTVLPSVLSVASLNISVWAAGTAADVFGASDIGDLLKNVSSVLSMALGILACFAFMLIISTAVMMLTANVAV